MTFFDWSLDAYSRPQASAILLKLQDAFGLNVNILLWCCWCAATFGSIGDLTLRKGVDLTGAWSREVTEVLRCARRALKTPPRQIDAAGAEALRLKVKDAELDAERLEQAMLETLACETLASARETRNPADDARRSLARYADLAGAVRRKGFSTLMLDELVRAVFVDASTFDAAGA